jgi:glycosyltransferase involved in cell wall biosynthesis
MCLQFHSTPGGSSGADTELTSEAQRRMLEKTFRAVPLAEVDVSLVMSGRDVADARLHRMCDAFTRSGLSVEVLGTGDPATAPRQAAVSARPRRGHMRRFFDALTVPFQARGRVMVIFDPDAVPAGWLRQRLRGGPLVVDMSEDYKALLADRDWAKGLAGLIAHAIVFIALAVARRADLVVVADDHVPPHVARNRLVVRNVPDGDYLPAPSDPDADPRAVYIGDLRRSRGLQWMIDAVSAASGWRLDLVGPVSVADRQWVDDWRATSPALDRVRLHGRLPPREAWRIAEGAWVGLALLDDTPAFRKAMPSKVYEYLGCGLAVLVSPLPRMAALVAESGAGCVAANAEEAAVVLRQWAADRASLTVARTAARVWAERNRTTPSAYEALAAEVARMARSG